MSLLNWYRDFTAWRNTVKTRDAKTIDEKIRTPEGYLMWTNVPIARTGLQLYARGELPLKDKDGIIQVQRDKSEVFNQDSLASYIGKPIVNDHPKDGDVNHKNWSKYAKGFVLSAYKKDNDDQYLYGDVLVTDKALQDDIEAGKCQLSVGYDALYKQDKEGYATQHNIYVNHLAVVDRGRAGSFCRIGDSYQFVEDAEDFTVSYIEMTPEQRQKEKAMLVTATQDADTVKRLAALDKLDVGSAGKGDSMEKEILEKLLLTMDSMNEKLDKLVPAKSNDTETVDGGGNGVTKNLFEGGGSPGAKPANTVGTQSAPTSGEEDQKQRDLSTHGTKDADIPTKDDAAKIGLFLTTVPETITLETKRQAVIIATQDSAISAAMEGILSDVKTADAVTLNAALAMASVIKRQAVNEQNQVNTYKHVDTRDADKLSSINKRNQEFWKKGE